MKKNSNLRFLLVLLAALAPLAGSASTFFDDTFTTSTINQPVVLPTATSTSYQTYVGLVGPQSSISPGSLTLASPSGGCVGEIMGLFATNAIPLTQVGDHIELDITFVNVTNIQSGGDNASATLNIGLFNSGGALPNQGNIQMNTGSISGGSQGWTGFISRAFNGGSSSFLARSAQTANGTTSQNQDLLFSNASSSQAFQSPAGTAIGTPSTTVTSITLIQGATYTEQFVCTLTNTGFINVSNAIYLGTGTAGTPVFSMAKTASGSTLVAGGFDGFAIGWRNTPGPQTNVIQLTHVSVTGFSTPVTTPPTINTQPVGITVPNGAAGAFTVAATGFNVVYQWHRHGTNLLNGGNISGVNSSILEINPVSAADVLSGANGYWVTVSGAGGFSTNSTTNSLALGVATGLIYTASPNTTWDVNTTANWVDTNNVAQVFNFGDPVTFDDTAALKSVNVTAPFLSPSSVIFNNTAIYTLTGNGSISGPGNMIVKNTGPIKVSVVNNYTGGTILSNTAASIFLQNLAGLGNGPITFAQGQPGGKIEVTPTGSAASGINSDIIVNDDGIIQFDGVGTFGGTVFGGLTGGTPGKTLRLEPGNTGGGATTNRFRIYGTNVSFDANLVIDDVDSPVAQANYFGTTFATYNSSGSQVYNGTISGVGGFIQRGSTTTFNGPNTYSGGTQPSTGMIGLGSDTTGSVTTGPIGTGPLFVAPEAPNLTGSGGIFAANGARTIANLIVFPSGTNNQTLVIGGTNDLTLSGAVNLNGLDGTLTFTNRTISVTNLGITTLSGVVSDGGADCGLTKTSAGILALGNTDTYTGPTLVSGGTLRVNGQVGPGPLVVTNSGSAVGGTGTITGPVTIATNSVLSPGTSSIGTLTVNSNLTLNGNVFVKVNTSLGQTSDKTVVSGALVNTGAGTVTVTNLGVALAANNRFVLFNKAVTGGGSLAVTGSSVTWSNGLAIDGSITVLGTVPITPTNISFTFSGANSLTLAWPSSYLGWSLQSNSVGITATNSWFTVPNSSSTTQINLTVDPAKNVFYRMFLIH